MSGEQQSTLTELIQAFLDCGHFKKTPPLSSDYCHGQELANPIHVGGSSASALDSDRQGTPTQYVKALLEQGLFEEALSLACRYSHDQRLGKDPVFLETALILFTNMEKLDAMWVEIKNLRSMDQLYPTAKTLSQYYIPAALLTAEMLLCKEWCKKTVPLSDLQQITTLWVALLWAQCGRNKEAFETKVRQVAKLVLHEPTFIMKLVGAIHTEVGERSLVLCVNLCLMAIQKPHQDPQSNLVNAGRIDANNAALCHQLSELLTADMSLRILCLLTSFTITPTKELFTEVDKLYKSSVVNVPAVPILPSCLSCVLVNCMYSLLPSTICPLVEWRDLRSKCLQYLHSSTVLNVQFKLPNQEVTMKMYVKEVDEDEAEKRAEPTEEAGMEEGPSEEADQNQYGRISTETEMRWLSSMMSLDMTWRPYWLAANGEDEENKAECPAASQIRGSKNAELGVCAQTAPAVQDNPTPCTVVLSDLEDQLPGPSCAPEASRDEHHSCQSSMEENPVACRTSFDEDHAYSLPAHQRNPEILTEGPCTGSRNAAGDQQKSTSEVIVLDSDEENCPDVEKTQGLGDLQQLNLDIPTRVSGEKQAMQKCDLQIQEGVYSHDDPFIMDPTISNQILDDPVGEVSLGEGQNYLQSGKSPKSQSMPTVDNTNSEAGDFLQDFEDNRIISDSMRDQDIYGYGSVMDEHPMVLPADVNRWFQNIEPSSVASGIMGPDVACNPATDQDMQWTPVGAAASHEGPTSHELSLNELNCWPSSDGNGNDDDTGNEKHVSVPEDMFPSSKTLRSRTVVNHKAEPGRAKSSLANTISRLRACLCEADSCADSAEIQAVDQQSTRLKSTSRKSTKRQVMKMQSTSQRAVKRKSTGPPPTQQQSSDGRSTGGLSTEPTPQSASLSSTHQKSTNQNSTRSTRRQSCSRRSTNQLLSNQNSAVQSHHQLLTNQQKPVTKSLICENKETSQSPTTTIAHQPLNKKCNNVVSSTEVFKPEVILESGFQCNSSRGEVSGHSDQSRNIKVDGIVLDHGSSEIATQYQDVDQGSIDLFTAPRSRTSSPCTSPESSVVMISADFESQVPEGEKTGWQSPNDEPSFANDSTYNDESETEQLKSLVPTSIAATLSEFAHGVKSARIDKNMPNSEMEKAEIQDDSRAELLRSLVSAAISEFQQIVESPPSTELIQGVENKVALSEDSPAEENQSQTSSCLASIDMSAFDCVTSTSKNKTIRRGEKEMRTLSCHSELPVCVEESSKTINGKPFQGRQMAASYGEREGADGCKKCKSVSCANQDTVRNSSQYLHMCGNQRNDKTVPRGPAAPDEGSSKDKTKDSCSDSDCSEFEVVQDLSSRWSVSGKRKTTEKSSWPHSSKRALHEEKTERSSKGSEMQGFSPPEGESKGGPIVLGNQSDWAGEKTAINCPHSEEETVIHHAIVKPSKADAASNMRSLPSPAGAKGDRSPTSPKRKSSSAETITTAEQDSSPPAHRYNLRAQSSVNQAPIGLSTVADLSRVALGEGKETQKAYCLRSTVLSSAKPSARNAKKANTVSKSPARTPGRATQRKPQRPGSVLRGSSRSTSTLRGKAQEQGTSMPVRQGSRRKSSNSPTGNFTSDYNNNCSSRSSSISSSRINIVGSPNSTAADRKAPLSTPTKGMSPKFKSATSGALFRGSFPAVKNPQLPWEAKPPLRTYSSKRNASPIM